MRLAAFLALLSAFTGCHRPSIYREVEEIRAEIRRMEKKTSVPQDAPVWIRETDARARPDLDDEDVFDRMVRDHTPSLPDVVYYHVLAKLAGMTDKEIAAQSKGTLSYEECLKNPQKYRGRFWSFRGTVHHHLRRDEIADPASPVREVFAGAAYVGGGQPVLFHLVEKPPILYVHQDSVEVVGIFVKIISVGPPGKEISAPLFLARSARRFL